MREDVVKALLDGMRQVRDRVNAGTDAFDLDQWKDTKCTCGFAGCLIGWAAHMQWLEPLGIKLGLVETQPWPTVSFMAPTIDGVLADDHVGGNTYALAKALGVNQYALQLLIYSENYGENCERVTPDLVIERLEYLLECGEDYFLDKYGDDESGWR